MEYLIQQDIESVLEIANLTISELANQIGVSRITVSNWLHNRTQISDEHLRIFYEYTFRHGIRLNKIKEQIYQEELGDKNSILLFHGAKTAIEGDIVNNRGRANNDFGAGFYCGEKLEQAAMFVAGYPQSSLYALEFNPEGLYRKEYGVNREWMLSIACHRGKLEEFKDSELVKNIIDSDREVDYIVAPIADNKMFEILDSFTNGEITDIQCQHCLSATNLGKQYIFISRRSLERVRILEKCYLTEAEKQAYLTARKDELETNLDKVKLARKQYRNQGEYIEDIVK